MGRWLGGQQSPRLVNDQDKGFKIFAFLSFVLKIEDWDDFYNYVVLSLRLHLHPVIVMENNIQFYQQNWTHRPWPGW